MFFYSFGHTRANSITDINSLLWLWYPILENVDNKYAWINLRIPIQSTFRETEIEPVSLTVVSSIRVVLLSYIEYR